MNLNFLLLTDSLPPLISTDMHFEPQYLTMEEKVKLHTMTDDRWLCLQHLRTKAGLDTMPRRRGTFGKNTFFRFLPVPV